MERSDMMQEWLEKALHKIDTMPREDLIAAMERYNLIDLEENINEAE